MKAPLVAKNTHIFNTLIPLLGRKDNKGIRTRSGVCCLATKGTFELRIMKL